MLKKYFLLLVIICFNDHTDAQTITVGGSNWITSIPTSTISEAGNDYVYNDTTSPYESLSNQILLTGTINGSLLFVPSSTISVSHSNLNFAPLTLSIRRTGIGNPCNNCSIENNALNSYIPLTTTPKNLMVIKSTNSVLIIGYTGGTYSNIPIQVKISGISVTVPTATYSSNIVFTIIAN